MRATVLYFAVDFLSGLSPPKDFVLFGGRLAKRKEVKTMKQNCNKLNPEHWKFWKGSCLIDCQNVSTCAIFAKGKEKYDARRDEFAPQASALGETVRRRFLAVS